MPHQHRARPGSGRLRHPSGSTAARPLAPVAAGSGDAAGPVRAVSMPAARKTTPSVDPVQSRTSTGGSGRCRAQAASAARTTGASAAVTPAGGEVGGLD